MKKHLDPELISAILSLRYREPLEVQPWSESPYPKKLWTVLPRLGAGCRMRNVPGWVWEVYASTLAGLWKKLNEHD